MKINTILLLIGKIKGWKTEKSKPETQNFLATGEREPLVNFGIISAAVDGATKPRSRGRSRLQANSRMRQYFTRMNDSKSSPNSKLKTMWDKRQSSPLDDMNLADSSEFNSELGMFGEPWDGDMISYS